MRKMESPFKTRVATASWSLVRRDEAILLVVVALEEVEELAVVEEEEEEVPLFSASLLPGQDSTMIVSSGVEDEDEDEDEEDEEDEEEEEEDEEQSPLLRLLSGFFGGDTSEMTSWGTVVLDETVFPFPFGNDNSTDFKIEVPHLVRVLCPIPLMANNSSVVVGNAFAIAAATFLGKSTSSCCCNESSMVL